jgi:hypothetical protein
MRRLTLAAAFAAALVAGCNSGVAPVGGTVTLDGKPLDGAAVSFTPAAGDPKAVGGSAGKTDPQGKYALKTVFGDKPGAMVGKHTVTVSVFRPDPANPEAAGKEQVPAKYNFKTELTFDVPAGGTDKADFDLKSK